MRRWLKGTAVIAVCGALAAVTVKGLQHWREQPVWAELHVSAALNQPHAFVFGRYVLQWQGKGFDLHTEGNPSKSLWASNGGFLAAGIGQAEVEEHRGSMFVSEQRELLCTKQSVESIEQRGQRLVIRGRLSCDDARLAGYAMILQADGDRGVQLSLAVDDTQLNRLYLSWQRDADEHFMGFGEQFSSFDLAGKRLPILVQEGGVGRGLQPVTWGADLTARAGGDWWTSYAPVPHYLTSKLRSFFSESSAYQVFDLRDLNRVQLETHQGSLTARIYRGDSPAQLIEAHTSVVGRMPALPEWTQKGAIVGMQGGSAKVREVLAQLDEHQVPLAGFWLQDWVGQRTTSFGKQLWWSWTLDKQHYSHWPELNAQLAARGIRSLAYVNPFLVDVAEKGDGSRNLYQEALRQGYLVRQQNDQPLELLNTSFSAGLVDITNPAARTWLKQVLKDEMLAAGFSGWMADFSEALPFDSKLASGDDAALLHNRFPEEWARLNRELITEVGGEGELLFFTRAGFSRSPGLTTSMWLGDQVVTWDADDGMHSALLGLLSGGLSGFSLNHSDIGGYTTLNNPLKDYHRSEELLLRWMELSAFISLFRSHEGNRPAENVQVYSSPAALAHFARFAKVFASLAPYRQQLMAEASTRGLPLVRPLWLHYPDYAQSFTDQPVSFLLGEQLLVAPVLEQGAVSVDVSLPAGRWVHLWSQQVLHSDGQQSIKVVAPLGQPPVFYRPESVVGQQLYVAVQQLVD